MLCDDACRYLGDEGDDVSFPCGRFRGVLVEEVSRRNSR
jgi:hypothetical protein